jgi:hypothetical protein
MIKGQKQYENFKAGKPLTPKQAILSQCYICNGEAESAEDCLGTDCPLYQYQPYRRGRKKKIKKELSLEEKTTFAERMKKGREALSSCSER